MKKYFIISALAVAAYIVPNISFGAVYGSSVSALAGHYDCTGGFGYCASYYLDVATDTLAEGTWIGFISYDLGQCYDPIQVNECDKDAPTGCGTYRVTDSDTLGSSTYNGAMICYGRLPTPDPTAVYSAANSYVIYGANADVTNFGIAGDGSGAIGLHMQAAIADTSSSLVSYLQNYVISPAPQVNFTFPQNATITPPFDNFWLTFANLTSTDIYAVQLDYSSPNVPNGFSYLSQVVTQQSQGTGQSLLHQGRLMTYSTSNFSVGTLLHFNVQVNAFAQLFDITDCTPSVGSFDCLVATSSIYFEQIPAYGDPSFATTTFLRIAPQLPTSTTEAVNPATNPVSGTSTNPFAPLLVGMTANGLCQDSANIVSYGFCTAIAALIDPATIPGSTSFMVNAFNNVKQAPPFSAFFQTASSVVGAAQSPTSTDGISIGILGFNNEQRTLVTINSSTFYNGFASSNNATTNRNQMAYLGGWIHAWLGLAALIKVLYVYLT